MKELVTRITHAVRRLETGTEHALLSAEASARVHRPKDRRHHQDRRRSHSREIVELREEFEDLKVRVARNAHNLEIQFARLAEIQVELNTLTGKKPPKFKG